MSARCSTPYLHPWMWVWNDQDRRKEAPGADAIERPAGLFTLLETARLGFETSALFLSGGLLAAAAPAGDGHSVLVLPGFATDDSATLLLRTFLASRGYDVHAWRLGWNLDHRTVGTGGERILCRIAALRKESGRPVSLVGWSLGGVIAREAARRAPGDIRQVVTLGSPFTGDPAANSVRHLYELLSGHKVDSPAALRRFAKGGDPLPVPSTAVFSKTDGIAAWRNCMARTDDITENVEVHSSHFGMIANPAVFHIVADRLAQSEGAWSPFRRAGIFSALYPGEATPA